MRDWSELDGIYESLFQTIYAQPEDEGHRKLAIKALTWAMGWPMGVRSVIDFGCGEGFCQPILATKFGIDDYLGIAWGQDVIVAQGQGRNVIQGDFNFWKPDREFDLGIARHSLEHSPFPIMTLCHWRKFVRWLLVVLPAPDHYTYKGQNHFNVMPDEQAENVFDLAGFQVRRKHIEYTRGLPHMVSPLT
jgi:hypothetical protein